MTLKSIAETSKQIYEKAKFWHIASISQSDIDKIGPEAAREKLWIECATIVRSKFPDIRIVVDGKDKIPGFERQYAVAKGDSLLAGVSAAAIIAKQYCDDILRELHQTYPWYNFEKHKGYPVYEHIEAIKEYGFCDAHRKIMAQNIMDNPPQKPEANLSLEELETLMKEIAVILG